MLARVRWSHQRGPRARCGAAQRLHPLPRASAAPAENPGALVCARLEARFDTLPAKLNMPKSVTGSVCLYLQPLGARLSGYGINAYYDA